MQSLEFKRLTQKNISPPRFAHFLKCDDLHSKRWRGIYLTSLPKGYLSSVWNQQNSVLFRKDLEVSTSGVKTTPQNTEECFEFGGDPSSTGLGRGSQVCCDVMLVGGFLFWWVRGWLWCLGETYICCFCCGKDVGFWWRLQYVGWFFEFSRHNFTWYLYTKHISHGIYIHIIIYRDAFW